MYIYIIISYMDGMGDVNLTTQLCGDYKFA